MFTVNTEINLIKQIGTTDLLHFFLVILKLLNINKKYLTDIY